jgi:hypothetical protein
MQHAPIVNIGTPAIPESTGRAYTALPPLDTRPPEKAAESPDRGLPEQIRAPVDAEGPLESLQGEASQHATRHTSQASVRAFEGKQPLGEAHGRPPDPPRLAHAKFHRFGARC